MKINVSKKIKIVSISVFSTLAILYLLFLILPFILSPIANSYSSKVEDIIKSSTGLDAKVEGLGIVTSPKLTAGVKIDKFKLSIPNDSKNTFFSADKFSLKVALLPFLIKKIQIDDVSVSNINANLQVKKNGEFLLVDYLKLQQNPQEPTEQVAGLPLGLKLSNHLPNIHAGEYKLNFEDLKSSKNYFLQGEKLAVKDFVLDKSVKFSTLGQIVLDNRLVSDYDVKVDNRIMPDLQLNDLVFPENSEDDISAKSVDNKDEIKPLAFNIIDIFNSINKNQLSANVLADVKVLGTIKKPDMNGVLKVDNMTVAVNGQTLPKSYANLKFKGHKTDIDSVFYSSFDKNEKTQIVGELKTGKNPYLDLSLISNAQFNNLIRLVDSVAQSFEIDDFKTLSAVGGIDANFNIKADKKKVVSNGYLKVLNSKITYDLYNIVVDKIFADVDLANNNVNIKNAGFSILGNPLKLHGTISNDSVADLNLNADNVSIKGLMLTLGQTALLKENDIKNGNVSLNAVVKGKLASIKPVLNVSVDNVDVFNKASASKVLLKNAILKISTVKDNISGDIDVVSLVVNNPMASISIPNTKIVMDSKDINIKKAYLLLNNSRIDISGGVKNYLSDKLSININANGKIASSFIAGFIPKEVRAMFPYAGKLPISVLITGGMKTQNISANVLADNSNYIRFADINLLRGKTSKIHSEMKLSGENLTLTNTGLMVNNKDIATVSGEVSKLYSSPNLNLQISIPQNVSFPIWGLNNSNITANGQISVRGDVINPILKGTVNCSDVSIKDMDFALTNLIATLNGPVLTGKAVADKFKFGGIVAEELSSRVSLVNYNKFYLQDIQAKAFDGKVSGNVSYTISDSSISVKLKGSGLNSTKAVYGAVGIKNALTGTLDFDTVLGMKGVTDKEIIQSMAGDVSFNIDEGQFLSIGRLEHLVSAQNVSSNSVLKSALGSLGTLSVVQNSNKYKYINGNLKLSNGVANINSINVAGPMMAYYVHGTYNVLANTAKLIILGRLDGEVVSRLGVLGELSAEKLLSFIPKFGALTANMLNQLTSDPANENTALIPDLTSGSTNYKDFKVVFNGSVASSASVRNFKWLSTCDTTQIDMKEELQNAKDSIKTNISERVEQAKQNSQNVRDNINNAVEAHKNRVEQAKLDYEQRRLQMQQSRENARQSAENLKNLFKNAAGRLNERMPEGNTSTPEVQPSTPEVQTVSP